MKIEITMLNNKSRKGRYVYIKEKGIRGKYYKYNPEIQLEYYIARYTDKTLNIGMKKYALDTPTEQAKKLIKEIKKHPRIQKQLIKGSNQITRQLKEMTQINSITEYKKLFRGLVINKKMLEIIIQNRSKLKSNMTHEVTINGIVKDTSEYGVLGIMKYHNMTIEELKQKLEGLKENMNVSSKTLKSFNPSTIKDTKQGLVRSIQVKTIFKK